MYRNFDKTYLRSDRNTNLLNEGFLLSNICCVWIGIS